MDGSSSKRFIMCNGKHRILVNLRFNRFSVCVIRTDAVSDGCIQPTTSVGPSFGQYRMEPLSMTAPLTDSRRFKKEASDKSLSKASCTLASPARFERAAFRLGGERSILLSYGEIFYSVVGPCISIGRPLKPHAKVYTSIAPPVNCTFIASAAGKKGPRARSSGALVHRGFNSDCLMLLLIECKWCRCKRSHRCS